MNAHFTTQNVQSKFLHLKKQLYGRENKTTTKSCNVELLFLKKQMSTSWSPWAVDESLFNVMLPTYPNVQSAEPRQFWPRVCLVKW